MSNATSGVTQTLAQLAAQTRYESLPPAAIDAAKLRILDTIGIMLAGARHPSTLISLELAEEIGGHAAASVVGHRCRTSSPLAGYVNGVAAAAEEYDDLTKGADTHISASITPGVLVVAEQLGVSGRELITGFAVGFEIAARIGRGLAPWLLDRGWHPNGITGALGVAAAAANMMRLDHMATRMAIGIAVSEASGVRRNVGSMAKAFHVGHGVRNGVFAALLAQKGFQVHPDMIEGDDVDGHGRFGLADTFNGIGKYRLERMVDGIGHDWELISDRTLVRLYPCSTAPGPAIDAMIELSATHDLKASDISRIEWETTPRCWAIAPYPEATSPFTAKFCLPYLMAVALIDRKAGIEQFKNERVHMRDVQDLLRKVTIRVPKDFERHTGHAWGENGVNWGEARLTLHLTDGRVLKAARSYARGWPEQPASWKDLAEKYTDCATPILPLAKIEKGLNTIRSLEDIPNVGELIGTLTPDS